MYKPARMHKCPGCNDSHDREIELCEVCEAGWEIDGLMAEITTLKATNKQLRAATIHECATVLDRIWRRLDETPGASIEARAIYDARNILLAKLLPPTED
jgi:hypothetical protein